MSVGPPLEALAGTVSSENSLYLSSGFLGARSAAPTLEEDNIWSS